MTLVGKNITLTIEVFIMDINNYRFFILLEDENDFLNCDEITIMNPTKVDIIYQLLCIFAERGRPKLITISNSNICFSWLFQSVFNLTEMLLSQTAMTIVHSRV